MVSIDDVSEIKLFIKESLLSSSVCVIFVKFKILLLNSFSFSYFKSSLKAENI